MDVRTWHARWDSLTTADQYRAQSCASLTTLAAHGHDRAWGFFAYPNDVQSAVGQSVVASCFAFGRKYNALVTPKATALTYPYRVYTLSVMGGQCNNPSSSCYTVPVRNNRRYMLPSTISALLSPGTDQYSIVQFYAFVTGTQLTGSTTWDCSSADPRDHWVTAPELYCFDDFKSALAARGSATAFTDPATVAQAWGRIVPTG
jgi:hypothetical protein